MTFHNVSFPTKTVGGQEIPFVEYGSTGGTAFAVSVFDSGAQRSHRVLRSSAPRDRFTLQVAGMDPDDARTLLDFYVSRRGPFASFRFKDFTDCTTTLAGRTYNTSASITNLDQIIGTGDGTATQFQLRKGYGESEYRIWRTIRAPVAGTVVVALDGVAQPSGWSVDTATGVITFTTAPGDGVQVTAGCEFEKVVRFDGQQGLQLSADGFGLTGARELVLIEEPEESPNADGSVHGGSMEVASMTESVTLSVPQGALVSLEATAAGLSAYLPEPSDIGDGMDYFLIRNVGTESLTLRDHQGGSLVTIGTASAQRVHLLRGSSGLSWITTAA